MIIHGDSYRELDKLSENSIDTVITDPPYGLKFMGKKWDYDIPRKDFWKKVYRVCKPGAIMLIFGGTRTYHRLAVEIEDAGFEIRDCIMWLYGQGFPKSHDISKAIDKQLGVEREITGIKRGHVDANGNYDDDNYKWEPIYQTKDKPASEQAQLWDGWGTALKPAWEPIIVAMKPLDGTFASNALECDVAGLNIDGARISTEDTLTRLDSNPYESIHRTVFEQGARPKQYYDGKEDKKIWGSTNGRFPANLILDEEAARILDDQSGISQSTSSDKRNGKDIKENTWGLNRKENTKRGHDDKGGASRFFYVAKASRKERDKGLDHFPDKEIYPQNNSIERKELNSTKDTKSKNNHPTVKPIALLEYLCTLTKTPFGGIVLDPFMGSGSLGIAAHNTGRDYIGVEIDEHYFNIAKARIEACCKTQ